jgi:hypothetical protein
MITTPNRSKIIIEHEDHVKYWARHLGVTNDELDARNRKSWQLCRRSSETTKHRTRLSLPQTQIRQYWWCSPPKIGMLAIRPQDWVGRGIGVSLHKDRCVRP